MNVEIEFSGVAFGLPRWHHPLFRTALLASVLLHIACFLASPYWQSVRIAPDETIPVDLAEIPARELPPIPTLAAPEARVGPAPERAPAGPSVPQAPPSREAIREKVSRQGLLRVLSRREPAGDALSGLRLPDDGHLALRGNPGAADYRPTGRPGGPPPSLRPTDPGIARAIASASRASTALASRVFTTDSGLEGRISGSVDDQKRSDGVILKTIEQYRSGIKYAYDRELMTNPDISGEITVAFVILPDGSVSAAEIRRSTVRWPALDDAVLGRIRHMKFPAARGGPVQVLFPFRFLPEI